MTRMKNGVLYAEKWMSDYRAGGQKILKMTITLATND
jgi:hypothetical protein